MRRGTVLLLTTGLLLSHAGMAWLGKAAARDSSRQAATDSKGTKLPGESDTNPWTVDALAKRLAERERKEKEDAKNHPETTWLEDVAAARAAMPAGTDFAALLAKALETMPVDGSDFSAEAVAAFGLWLDRDPAAAMTWIGLTGRDHILYDFECELERWMKAGAYRQLQDYLKRFPLAGMLLMDAAGEIAEECGPDFALELAATLTNSKQRLEFLGDSLESDDIAGRLGKIRALMNETQAREFLLEDVLNMGPPTPEFLAEIRAAGFSPAVLQEYEKGLADRAARDEKQVSDDSAAGIAQRVRQGDTSALLKALPHLEEWCSAVEQGRMTPEEAFSRAREAWPQGAAEETRIRSIIAADAMPADAVGTLRWLRESGTEEEWSEALDRNLHSLTAEQMAAVLAELPPGTDLGENGSRSIQSELLSWWTSDPEGYAAAREQMAGDERNQDFLKRMDAAREFWEKRKASEEKDKDDATSGEGGGP